MARTILLLVLLFGCEPLLGSGDYLDVFLARQARDSTGQCIGCDQVEGACCIGSADGVCSRFQYCVGLDGVQYVDMECPPGLFWNQQKNVCDYPSSTKCQNDPCSTMDAGSMYPFSGNCRGYYICRDGWTDVACCATGHAFVTLSASCEADSQCTDECPFTSPQLEGIAPRRIQDDRSPSQPEDPSHRGASVVGGDRYVGAVEGQDVRLTKKERKKKRRKQRRKQRKKKKKKANQ